MLEFERSAEALLLRRAAAFLCAQVMATCKSYAAFAVLAAQTTRLRGALEVRPRHVVVGARGGLVDRFPRPPLALRLVTAPDVASFKTQLVCCLIRWVVSALAAAWREQILFCIFHVQLPSLGQAVIATDKDAVVRAHASDAMLLLRESLSSMLDVDAMADQGKVLRVRVL